MSASLRPGPPLAIAEELATSSRPAHRSESRRAWPAVATSVHETGEGPVHVRDHDRVAANQALAGLIQRALSLVLDVAVLAQRRDASVRADRLHGIGGRVGHVQLVGAQVARHSVAGLHERRLREELVRLDVAGRVELDLVHHAVAEKAHEQVALAVEGDAVGPESPVLLRALEGSDDVRIVRQRGLELHVLLIQLESQHRAPHRRMETLDQHRLGDVDVVAADGGAVGHVETLGHEDHLLHLAVFDHQPPHAGLLVLVLHVLHVGQVQVAGGRHG